jgi:hypothetical protein
MRFQEQSHWKVFLSNMIAKSENRYDQICELFLKRIYFILSAKNAQV